ncbi:hypothetical protein DS901_10905 [Loktanella sp. D2R18]|uniref:DUF6478 family protein n=1 Tax=Rhodobacterales TaxID=204455 RepID=UPI000DE80F09|nr:MULTISPECIES: DUF6478 family protein [Rhodobacterales]MDO6590902.1 DUF6478 family protein [Yoonia sp. 1_MG-2023]RBW43319.1 hypothetical protein DS901_10905 [Loktanella sp. D2R18]
MNPNSVLGRLAQRVSLARWAKAARAANSTELTKLRALRQNARQLLAPLQELNQIAETRLARPRIGSTTFARPVGTDWSWRPMVWRAALPKRGLAPAKNKDRLGHEIGIFHDCKQPEITLSQYRNSDSDDLAAYGVALEVFHFDGSFLSLVLDLPTSACDGLKKRHVLEIAAVIDREVPINIYARLNLKHGPNTEQSLLTLPAEHRESSVAFDLAYMQVNEARAEKIWIDLLFETPQMNKITIRDVTVCRYPRAEI